MRQWGHQSSAPVEETLKFDLQNLIDIPEPADLSTVDLADLRELRARLDTVENGLSYARRIVQGRLDTLGVEVDRRRSGDQTDDGIVGRLTGALAEHTRGSGLPRPPAELEPPEWAHEIIAEADEYLTPGQFSDLAVVGDGELSDSIERMAEMERTLSATRRELHGRIDRVQAELVDRYRSGASVDDLLR